jgi:hypothetical protein
VKPTPAPTPSPAPGSGWARIADEDQTFALSGTQTVRYGDEPYWITRTLSGSGACTNQFFQTDPVVGVRKHCEAATTMSSPVPPPASGSWTKIADEGQGFSVSGTQTVRFGAGDELDHARRHRLRRMHERLLWQRSGLRHIQAVPGRHRAGVDAHRRRVGRLQRERHADGSVRQRLALDHEEHHRQRRLHELVLWQRSSPRRLKQCELAATSTSALAKR